MRTEHIAWVLVAVLASLALNVFAGPRIAASLSTVPALNRLGVLQPQAPIVINRREEVRVSDGEDVLRTIQDSKNRVAAVSVASDGGELTQVGVVTNLADSGTFIGSAASVRGRDVATLRLVLPDGRVAPVLKVVLDPATPLAFLQTNLSGMPVARFTNAAGLRPAVRLVALSASPLAAPRTRLVFVTQAEDDYAGGAFAADHQSRSFAIDASDLPEGTPLLTLGSEVAGFWMAGGTVSAEVAEAATARYLSSGGAVRRPAFGFTYRYQVSASGSPATLAPVVVTVDRRSAAQVGGLLEGDVVTEVQGQPLSQRRTLEQALEQVSPGDAVLLTVRRSQKDVRLEIQAGELR